MAKYPWVGSILENEQPKEKLAEGEEPRTPHAKSLFMAADNTMITIGGGYVGNVVGIASSVGFWCPSLLTVFEIMVVSTVTTYL